MPRSDAATLATLATPALVLDTSRLDRNLARLRTRMAERGVTLRPHMKTAKSIDVARRAFPNGPGPITISTLAEAEYFAGYGYRDMTYAVGISRHTAERAMRLREAGVDIKMLLDTMEQAAILGEAGRAAGVTPAAFIEIDCDGHRGGLLVTDPKLLEVAAALEATGIALAGVLTHAGESYALTSEALEAAAENERVVAVDAATRLRATGHECPIVSVGSTPTAHFATALHGVTEMRAGVYMFFDLVMHGVGVCTTDDIALSVLSTVIGAKPEKGWIMVDAGWMALSRDRGTAAQRVDQGYGLVSDPDGRLYPDLIVACASQEHGTLAIRSGSSQALPELPVGAKVRILPNHACATGSQHERYHVVPGPGGAVEAEWPRIRAGSARSAAASPSTIRAPGAHMKLTSYWLDTSKPFSGSAKGPVEGTYDVAVIGGGLTGSSAALALARKGARVILLEAETIGHAASGRNGGMCNNGFAQDYRMMSAKLGRETADRLYRAFDAGVDTVERLIAEEGIDCNFARVGKIKLAAKPEHYDKLARAQELLAAHVDPDTEMVRRADLAAEIGSERYYGGLIYRKSATIHIGRFVRGLAEAATRHGVAIHERTPMTGLKPAPGGGHTVETPKGKVLARQVVLASGISHTGPLGWVRRRIVPVGAFLIVTEPLPVDLLDKLTPRRRNAVDTKNLVNYFRTTPDNRLLFGGRARFAVSNPGSDEKSGAILRTALHDVFPELREARIDYCWGGMVDMTRDRLPRAGERNGIYYSMGYSGHGTQMSTLMGTIMAEVMDGRAELNPWKDFAWPAIPGHFGKPWFLPLVGTYYRIKDRFQ